MKAGHSGALPTQFAHHSVALSWPHAMQRSTRGAAGCPLYDLEPEIPVEHSFVYWYNTTEGVDSSSGGGCAMARRKSLATMSLDALVKLRDDVTAILGSHASAMQDQLVRITGLGNGSTRRQQRKSSKPQRRKAASRNRRKKSSAKRARSRRTAAQSIARAKRGVSRAARVAKKSAGKANPAPVKAANRARTRRPRAKPVTPRDARPESKLDAVPAQASSAQTQAGQE